jgi:hypothetical protein
MGKTDKIHLAEIFQRKLGGSWTAGCERNPSATRRVACVG